MARTVTFKEMNGFFASLIRHEYFANVRMLDRVICGCFPQQHPQITRYNIRTSAFYPGPIITVTVIIAYAADVAIVPVAGSIASWLFLR